MRKYRILALLLFAAILFIPYVTARIMGVNPQTEPPEAPSQNSVFDMEITLFRTKTGKVETINCYDYICGVVAGEMQANYEPEALKAQTVAAFTYTVNKMNYVKEHPESDIGHSGAYVCDDFTHCKAYLPKSEARDKWGREWYDKYYPNIENAVALSLGRVITFDGQPINAVFHSISNGRTSSAAEVWGSEVSYLTGVDCAFDKTARGYTSTVALSHKEFKSIFYEELGVELPDDYKTWIGDTEKSESGMVERISIAGTAYAGTHIRKLFSLRSATFDLAITDTEAVFTVCGYGHGVGMSQNGANEMAKTGKTCDEILTYFYSGTIIENFNI